jgi:LysM repeat protein
MVERAYAQLTPAERTVRLVPGVVKTVKGDTPQSLAKSYGVSLSELVALNPRLKSGQVKPGQKLLVPGAQTASESKPNPVARPTSVASAPAPSAPSPLSSVTRARAPEPTFSAPHRDTRKLTHVVAKGDTIWNIAQQYGLDHKEIERANGIKNGQLALGQKLTLYVPPSKAEAKVETKVHAVPVKESREHIYRVQKGDTLWNISKRFNVSPDDLKRWNGMSDSSLSVGDTLKLKR